MNLLYDYERPVPLLSSFYTITGIRADLYDLNFGEICINEDQTPPFCALINGCPEGHERCLACDREAKSRASSGSPVFYRCHAGICESILSICEGSTPLAYMFCGQYLDDTDPEEQWEQTKKALGWYPGDLEQLHRAFLQFRQYSEKEVAAYAEILRVLASYIRLEGLIQSTGQKELQRLEHYLNAHYTEKLSLDSVASALGVGRTKLCALAKELSGGGSLSKMITQWRISAAKELLRKGDAPETTPVETQPVAAEKTQITVIAAQYGQLTADWWVGFEAANETIDLVVDVVSWKPPVWKFPPPGLSWRLPAQL